MANKQYTGDKCENCIYDTKTWGHLTTPCIIHEICEKCDGFGYFPFPGNPDADNGCYVCEGRGFQNKIDMTQITKEIDELYDKMQTPEFKKNMDEFRIYLANKFKIP